MNPTIEAIEPEPAWLTRCREELRFGTASLHTDVRDANKAALILASCEVDHVPAPMLGRDDDGAVRVNWCNRTRTSVSTVNIRIKDGQVFFSRHLNGRRLPLARCQLAKGIPATLRELLQWLFTSDIHRRVEDVSELLQGE